MGKPSIVADFRRLAKFAIAAGAILAWLCPMLPENYRVPCEALLHICKLGAGGH